MSLSPDEIAYMKARASDDKRGGIIVANIVCIVAAIIAVVLRFWSRRLAAAGVGLDDWCILISVFVTLGYIIAYSITTVWGMGRHAIFITNIYHFATSAIVAECLYNVAIPIIKISILLLYRRIFPQRSFRIALIGVGLFICSYSAAQFFTDIFQCTPVKFLWDPTVPGGHCIQYGSMVLTAGIINILTDFIMLAMPLPLLWHLQLGRNKKLLLPAIFLMGGFACIVSIVRLFFAKQVGSSDPSWDDVNGATISTVECCVGIVSACLPTYRPLLNYIRHGHIQVRSVNWPSRNKGSQQQPIVLEYRTMDSKEAWNSIPERNVHKDEDPLSAESLSEHACRVRF